MKQNGNNKRVGNYYCGLDVGSASVGWAVTDKEYNVKKFKGNSMWGARLFEEAQTAVERRTARTARRRLARSRKRLDLLEMLFSNEIVQKDPSFFIRMHDSNLWPEDKRDTKCRYALFNDPNYTDKDYLKQYPTVYHLRSELIHPKQPHDVRLVFLALHHIMKSRGHFLYESAENSNGKTLRESIQDLSDLLQENDMDFKPENPEKFAEVLASSENITSKKSALKAAYGKMEPLEDEYVDIGALLDLLSGATVQLAKLFGDDELKEAELKSISLKDDLESKYDVLSSELNEKLDLINSAKMIFDIARLGKVLGGNQYISDAKIAQYNKNAHDLKVLKGYVKRNCQAEYKNIFNCRKDVKNYAAYSRYKTEERCSQEDFCKFLETKLKGRESAENAEERRVYNEICEKEFLPKLKGTVNGIIPYQLHKKELEAILENAAGYLPFLNEKDEDGLSVADKILKLFTFRIPYYVGPLNRKSERSWVERTDEKIYPWNFEKVVDEQKSAAAFMNKLIGRCTYTGEAVLPLNSLLYSEFMVLNEINNIKINGQKIPVETKKEIYDELFVKSARKVTKKKIFAFLLSKGLISNADEISGVDMDIKSSLKSYHDFQTIIEKTGDLEQVERIIQSVLVFSGDKGMLKKWLKDNTHGLTSEDIKHILHLNYKEWGRLSKVFLKEIYTISPDGEALSILDMLRSTENNLMELLSSNYQFSENATAYREEHYGMAESIHDRLDEMYIAPSVKRSIWQTLRIVDEITDIEKSAPAKIFIEMARTSSKKMKKERMESRKNNLLKLYESCKEQNNELYEKLQQESDQTLRRDKLFLYYTQLGRCMYSGEPIDLEKLLKDNETYDIDHIFPRSRIKDNSINNRVLVKSTLNRDKTNVYPITDNIRTKMEPFWSMLHDKKLITDEKYLRLKRNYELTDAELSSFVARQIVETQQSTKALATILQTEYPSTKIVYSKAGNVSDFRQEFDLPKFRDVNDLHHAKDAYLNVVVGNVYATKFTDKFFQNIRKENYSLNRVFDFDTAGAWKADGSSIALVKRYMRKNNPIVTFAPYHQKGALFDLQIKPKGQGQLETKSGRSIDRYGGYQKLTGGYYCLVEHTIGKKTVRSLEPVYLYLQKEFDEDPAKYCTEILKLCKPHVIVRQILNNSLFELEGSRVIVTGRTGPRNVYKHAYQLAIDDEHAKYLKYSSKYVDRCTVARKALQVMEYDVISKSGNTEMYDWFIGRLKSNVYQKLFNNMLNDLENNRDKFNDMDILDQSKLLLEILKAFKCDRQCPNFKALNGKGTVGIIGYSSTLSVLESAYLINQSVTGLFEVKVDLLK